MSGGRPPRLPPLLAVGFDLGETLYHYREGPMSWLEVSRPAIEALTDALGLDRETADFDAAERAASDLGATPGGGLSEVNLQDTMARMLHALGGDASRQVEEAVDSFFDAAREHLVAYPDAAGTLAELRRRGFKIGVLTNVPYGMPRRTILEDLERTGLASCLDAVVSSADVGVRKPDRAPYQWLAAGLGVGLRETAYVGNSENDMRGALAAGAVPVLVDRVHEPSDFGQTATIAELAELPGLLGPAPGE